MSLSACLVDTGVFFIIAADGASGRTLARRKEAIRRCIKRIAWLRVRRRNVRHAPVRNVVTSWDDCQAAEWIYRVIIVRQVDKLAAQRETVLCFDRRWENLEDRGSIIVIELVALLVHRQQQWQPCHLKDQLLHTLPVILQGEVHLADWRKYIASIPSRASLTSRVWCTK